MTKEELLQELQSFSVIELLELYVESRTGKYINIYEYDIEHLEKLNDLLLGWCRSLIELQEKSRTGKYIDIPEYDIEHLPQLEIVIDDILNEIHYKTHTPTKS
jgi:hypothetical protein